MNESSPHEPLAPGAEDVVPERPLPLPPSHARKLGPIRRFFALSHSSIHTLYERSYDMRLGDVRAPTRSYFFVNDVPLVNQVLGAEPERYPKSQLMTATLRQLLGDSILSTNGSLWRKQRRMLSPAFERASIATSFEPMVDAAIDMNQRLSRLAGSRPVDVDMEMTHVTADVIFRTTFSKKMGRDEAEVVFADFGRYQELAWRHSVWMMAGVPERLSLPRLRSRAPARRIRALLRASVDERLAAVASGGEKPDDILQRMIDARDPETGDVFDSEALVDQVAITFFAGHETSASGLAWTLLLLARHPAYRERIEREADLFWSAPRPNARDLRLLKDTRNAFREALRLYPPIAFLSRDTVEPETMRGKRMAKGSGLFISPFLMHRQRRIWKRPDAFDPDRFARPEDKDAIRDAYIPFIKGPRVCLGASFALQEAVIILSAIASRFRVTDDPTHDPQPIARLTLRSANGVRLRLTPRDARPAVPAQTVDGVGEDEAFVASKDVD